MYKHHSGLSPESRLLSTVDILTQSHHVLRGQQSINIGYLEGIAGIRFSIMEVANLLHSGFIDDTAKKSRPVQQVQFVIMQLAEELCVDPAINTTDFAASDVVGPAIYLLKLLVRQFGFPCLKHVSEHCQWIIPEDLRIADQVLLYSSTCSSDIMHIVVLRTGEGHRPICDI